MKKAIPTSEAALFSYASIASIISFFKNKHALSPGLKGMMLMLALSLLCLNTNAQVWVDGYLRRDGTYVEGHYRTYPNSTKTDNYSYPGNYNPNTGKITGGYAYDSYTYRTYPYAQNVLYYQRDYSYMISNRNMPFVKIDNVFFLRKMEEGWYVISDTANFVAGYVHLSGKKKFETYDADGYLAYKNYKYSDSEITVTISILSMLTAYALLLITFN